MKKISLEEFEKEHKKYKTVGELVEFLLTLPQDTSLNCTDADSGGYDVSSEDWATVRLSSDGAGAFFGTSVYEAYHEMEYEDYSEFVEKSIRADLL